MSFIKLIFFLLLGKILSSEFNQIDNIEAKFLFEMSDNPALTPDESNDSEFSFDEIVTRKK
jgi:hypothetical protein